MRRTNEPAPVGIVGRSMLLDRHPPEYDAGRAATWSWTSTPGPTYGAALVADLTDTGPAVRALPRQRDPPSVVSGWLRSTRREPVMEWRGVDPGTIGPGGTVDASVGGRYRCWIHRTNPVPTQEPPLGDGFF